jgi:serine/threonine-protein kinase RsbW
VGTVESRLERHLDSAPSSASVARDAIASWLTGCAHDLRTDARLAVSELVTNAFRYGRPPITLVATRSTERLRIEVADGGDASLRLRRPGPDGGWGLRIVNELAANWGIGPDPGMVWCELRMDGYAPGTNGDA